MPIKIIAFSFLFFTIQLSAAENQNDNFEFQGCYTDHIADACTALAQGLTPLKRFPEALKASEMACDLNPNHCDQLMFLASPIGKKATDAVLEKLTVKCKNNVDVCNNLANALEMVGKYKESIAAAKVYYDKHKSGNYAWFSYKYGDKKAAFSASLEECNLKKDCVFYMRYMPDHPQYDLLVKQSESGCKSQTESGEGATICTIVGSYFIKKKNFSSAYENLSTDCSHNGLACLLIVGTPEFSEAQRNAAALQFCETHSFESHQQALLKNNCPQIKLAHKIPPAVVEYSVEMVKAFLSEQH